MRFGRLSAAIPNRVRNSNVDRSICRKIAREVVAGKDGPFVEPCRSQGYLGIGPENIDMASPILKAGW